MKFSVVIPTYNRRPLLARTLPTVLTQDFPAADYEVIVVSDGSSDGTMELLRDLRPKCALRLVEQPNRGQCAANNAGLRQAQGEYVLFLDDDLICSPSLLSVHAEAHARFEDSVVCGPSRISAESPRSLEADWLRQFESASPEDAPRVRHWPEDIKVDANTSIARAVLLGFGGFNESFGHGREDADLGLRLWKGGLRFWLEPRALTHQVYVKSRAAMTRDASAYGRNEVRLCREHPEYRAASGFARMQQGGGMRVFARQLGARLPISVDPALRLLLRIAEPARGVAWVKRVALRLLTTRWSLAFYRAAVKECGSWSAFQGEFGVRLTALLYHHVGDTQPGPFATLTVSPQSFRKQLRWLRRLGYSPISPQQWLNWIRGDGALPTRPVVLTFDDGYADLAQYAFPILEQHGFPAAVYAVTGIESERNEWDIAEGAVPRNLLSAEQLKQWSGRGITVAAHSSTHSDLTRLRDEQLRDDLQSSRASLTEITGSPPTSFAYPFGAQDRRVRYEVGKLFPMAWSVEEGTNRLGTDLKCLRRTMVQPGDNVLDFFLRLRCGTNWIERLRRRIARRRGRLQPQGAGASE